MDSIFKAYDSARQHAIKGDFIDRLHSKYSVVLLFGIIIVIGIRQYDGQAITCWLPTHYSGSQTGYTHQLCWVNNTYYYPEVTDADLFPESSKFTIHYYQYILFILFGMSLLFMVPDWLWKILSTHSSGYVKKLLDQLQRSNVINSGVKSLPKSTGLLRSSTQENNSDSLVINDEVRNNFLNGFSSLVHNENEKFIKRKISNSSFDLNQDKPRNRKFKLFRKSDDKVVNFMKPNVGLKNLTLHYMLLKMFNLINVIVQLIFLHFMFGPRFYSYGLDFFVELWNNKNPYNLTTQFPIITFCDYFIHTNLHKIHWNAAQCLLAINIVIEKMFVLIWFWYILLLGVTVLNIFAWCLELSYSNKIDFLFKYLSIRNKMVRNKLNSLPSVQEEERMVKFDNLRKDIVPFYKEYLGTDGIFMLHMVKNVAGSVIFMDLLYELWIEYKKKNSSAANQDNDSTQ
ncbi:unnamed protein product [Brachionus calyciflorus]|uniref:Innexin n=1 Tax=Brachionus calyciflorus TaxID=104777 RepID=A0A813X6W3_9BILA|nr:unnamed protein product [Brachionus calyciflorus]